VPDRIDVILGFDFGTRFSKVCYRVLDGSRPAVVTMEPGHQKSTILDSILWVDPVKHFITSLPGAREGRALPLYYLKMLLMGNREAEVLICTES